MTKAGRKPKDGVTRETRITIKISEEEYARLLKIADFVNLPKSVAARNLLLFGLDEMEGFKRLGFLSVAKGIIKTSDFIKKITKIKKENE